MNVDAEPRALLDVNVLLALLDRSHVDHDGARRWLTGRADPSWASCAITQNGYVRIVSQASYPRAISTAAAIDLLAGACRTTHHDFWPSDLSILDASLVDPNALLGPKQLTDVICSLLPSGTAADWSRSTAAFPLLRSSAPSRTTS